MSLKILEKILLGQYAEEEELLLRKPLKLCKAVQLAQVTLVKECRLELTSERETYHTICAFMIGIANVMVSDPAYDVSSC